MTQKNKKPEVITLSHEEVESLKQRLTESSLASSDQKIILSILSVYFWIQSQLSRAQLTILRLKKIFGFSTEKKRP
jgi:hypothetical protein